MNEFQGLIGSEVYKIYLKEDKTVLVLETSTGLHGLHTDGDCCSESWIEHIDGADDFQGYSRTKDTPAIIEKVEEVDLGEVVATRQESDQLYCFNIYLTSGRKIQIEFRNSSNGYYGGTMDYCFIERLSPEYKELTEDF